MRRVVLTILGVVGLAVIGVGIWLFTPDKPRAALEAAYAAPPSTFVLIDGVRLHVRDTGPRDAPAVIFLHGFGSSLHTWEDWAHSIEADFRVIRYDQPGFGLTGPDPSGDYSDTRSVAVLTALMDRLGLARADIVGHSMGGRIAWTFAATHPERVAKLVLMAPDGFASPGLAYGVAPRIPVVAKALRYVLPRFMVRMSLVPAFGNRTLATDALLTRYRDMLLAPGVRGAILQRMEQTVLVDPEPLLHRISAPTLLVWGDKDPMVPISNAADYLRDIARSRLDTMSGLGHLPQEEAAAETIEPVERFLKEPD